MFLLDHKQSIICRIRVYIKQGFICFAEANYFIYSLTNKYPLLPCRMLLKSQRFSYDADNILLLENFTSQGMGQGLAIYGDELGILEWKLRGQGGRGQRSGYFSRTRQNKTKRSRNLNSCSLLCSMTQSACVRISKTY